MAETIVVEERFRGPPTSGNGGYVAGRLARYVDAPAVQVRLMAPPPLETPLEVTLVDAGAELRHGDVLVATARPAELELAVPGSVDVPTATAAAAAWGETFLRAENHPFPSCFGCGPLRERGDALRHLCGPVGDGPLMACPATTDPALPHDADGALAPEIVWASLDCPSASAAVAPGSPPHVLGTLTARLERPVLAGAPHVCVSWPLGADGRKKRAGSAVLDERGRVCAVADALWIELRA
jgi:hypothetical protein